MNWEGPEVEPLEAFLAAWWRATRDREWRPPSGDSSAEAGARFLEVIAELATSHAGAEVALVSHGGATTDALRDLLGDDELRARAPRLLDDGVPPCAITDLEWRDDGWSARTIATTRHLAAATRPPRRRS
jgi:broad specificity phosphatase PhoE